MAAFCWSSQLSPRQREDNTTAHLRQRHAAAVAQNDDADLSFRYQSDIDRGVVHPAIFINDCFVAAVDAVHCRVETSAWSPPAVWASPPCSAWFFRCCRSSALPSCFRPAPAAALP